MAKVKQKPLYLYQIPRQSRLKLKYGKVTREILLHHLDGMYSYCTVGNDPNAVLHLSAITPLKKYKDYYLILD